MSRFTGVALCALMLSAGAIVAANAEEMQELGTQSWDVAAPQSAQADKAQLQAVAEQNGGANAQAVESKKNDVADKRAQEQQELQVKKAQDALDAVDQAISQVTDKTGEIGAFQAETLKADATNLQATAQGTSSTPQAVDEQADKSQAKQTLVKDLEGADVFARINEQNNPPASKQQVKASHPKP